MIFLDTGYFVALLNPRDELHSRALAWSETINEPLLVTEYVLWETINTFSLPPDRPKAHALVHHLQSEAGYEIISATPQLFQKGIEMHQQRPDKERSLTDCISFLLMRERGITRALAHDQHFEQAGFEALLRRSP